MKFADLDLHPHLFAAIEKLGFTEATPIQEAIMPHAIEGKDTAGLAQTGTGKTAAFLLPLMERIIRSRQNPEQLSDEDKVKREARMFPEWKSNNFILVLVPTRELCEQVYEHAMKFVGDSGLRAVSIYGGVSYEKQKAGLRDNVEFVIATPGRLIDLFKEHLVDLKQVRAIVFDEADRMFDMGFKDDMKFVLERIPKTRQFMVFSATLNLDVMNTAYQYGAYPVEVNVSRDSATADNVDDKIFHIGQEEKGPHLLSLLKLHKPRQAIVFSNFKMNVPKLTQFLTDNGLGAVGISSLLTQSQRNKVMEQFKGSNEHNILVATDVAARGLDIKGVDMVVNFELPDDPENYVHRIGRTGRAGEKGIAFSLVSERDVDSLARVEQYLKKKVESGFLEEKDLVKDYKAMYSDRGRRDYGDRAGSGSGGGGRGGSGSGSGGGRGGGGREGGRGRDGGGGRGEARPPREAGAGGGGGRGGSGSGSGSGSGGGRGPRPERAPREGDVAGAPLAAGSGPIPASDSRPRPVGPGGRGPRPEGEKGAGREGGRSRRGGRGGAERGEKSAAGQNGGGRGPQAQGARSANGNGGPKHGSRPGGPKSGPIPKGQGGGQPTIGKKVSGFFKRLFGG